MLAQNHKIMAHESSNEQDAEYDDPIPLSELRRNLLSLDEDTINVLAEQFLKNLEIRNWLENDEDLLPLEDINATDEQQDSDNENPELNKSNKTVKNDEAVKSLNLCIN
ncbi:unnamed protein product [Psylliodes chrysocephalus]|uniref:Uncharacterized protein n=1 Tax=Psylliodes chrysocephalus TaxID=3402493 RepID=A0A9P0G8R5_9CUCU|nr:unnamed protein product [Psylliodes chrysocephala]